MPSESAFIPSEPLTGTYRIVSVVNNGCSEIHTLSRRGKFSVIEVNHDVIKFLCPKDSLFGNTDMSPSANKPDGPVFEVRENGQFRVPVVRHAEKGELAEIDGPPKNDAVTRG